jgi:predicted GIY-YIG superfamily endonuclease
MRPPKRKTFWRPYSWQANRLTRVRSIECPEHSSHRERSRRAYFIIFGACLWQAIYAELCRSVERSIAEMWNIYILQCSDKSYYVGHTNNLTERNNKHNAGRAVRWTACRLPVHLVYKETFKTLKQAMKRERQIKKWSRAKKEALIRGDTKTLRTLAKKKTKHFSG